MTWDAAPNHNLRETAPAKRGRAALRHKAMIAKLIAWGLEALLLAALVYYVYHVYSSWCDNYARPRPTNHAPVSFRSTHK